MGHEASSDGRNARWENHRAMRRVELIRAARHAVHTLGPDASMEEIAAEAGTSKPVFYRYFGDKRGLQQSVGEAVLARMQQRIQEAASSARTAEDGLQAMIGAYLHMAQTSPNVYAFVTQDSPATPGSPLGGTGYFGTFFDVITDMISQPLGEILGLDHQNLRFWPAAAIGLVRGSGEEWLHQQQTTQTPDAESMARTITSWLLSGLTAPSTTSPHQGIEETA